MSFLLTRLAHGSQLCKDSYPAGMFRDMIDVGGHGPCAGQLCCCPLRLQQISARMVRTNSFKGDSLHSQLLLSQCGSSGEMCGTASFRSSSGLYSDCARRPVMGDCEANAQCCPGTSNSGRTFIISFAVKLSGADSGKFAFQPTFGELGNVVFRSSRPTDYQI